MKPQPRQINLWQRFVGWRYRDQLILGVMVVAVVVANQLWVGRETRPPNWDTAYHLTNSLSYQAAFKSGQLTALLQSYHYYPPLVYWVATLFYEVLGTSITIAVLSNLVWISLLVFATYGLGRILYDRRAGLLAAIFVISTPMLVSQFKEFQLDAPLTAMVAVALYLLIKSNGFRHRDFTVALGASVGLGLLTKWTFPFIMALPVLTAIIQAGWYGYRHKDYGWTFNLAFAALLAYAIASPWYITNHLQLHADLVNNGVSQGAREGDPAVASWASISYYWLNLLNFQLYLVPLVAFGAGLVASWRRPRLRLQAFYPLLLIIGTIGFFTVLRNKDARYTLPMLPAVAVVAVGWISGLERRWRQWLSIGVVAYSLLAFSILSFGLSLLPSQVVIMAGRQPLTLFAQQGYIIGAPTSENWHMEELFQIIERTQAPAKTLTYAGPDTIWFNGLALNYYAQLYNVSLLSGRNQFLAVREPSGNYPIDGYNLLNEWRLPDGQWLRLYQKQP